MAIKTDIARHYYWRQVITAVICIGLSAWGAYDLFVAIPAKERAYAAYQYYQELQPRAETGRLSQTEWEDYQALEAQLDALGETPEKPNRLDRLVQWMFILCILWVPWCIWRITSIRRNGYMLDDDGALHLPGGEVWSRDEIAGIDMSRWMAKSIAWVSHADGPKAKLDAYLHRDLEKIIGAIAHRFEPEQWNPDGTKVVTETEDEFIVPDEDLAAVEEDAAAER